MKEMTELKFTASMVEEVTLNEQRFGFTFHRVLIAKSQDLLTDRLLVSYEGVRVLTDVRN